MPKTTNHRKAKKSGSARHLPPLAGAVVAAALAVGLLLGWDWFRANRIEAFPKGGELYVRPSDTVDSIVDGMPECRFGKGVVRKVIGNVTPGHYVIKKGATLSDVEKMLRGGWQTPVNVTLSGAMRTYPDIAAKLGSQLMLDSDEILSALRDRKFLAKYDVTPETAFSLFLPDTYNIWWNVSLEGLFDYMKRQTDAFWTVERKAKASKIGLTPMQVTIVASIVRSESLHSPEYSKIAGVYLNRLRRGQRLQADPTIAFIYDYKLDRVLKKHLEVDSPYNTYRRKGLPPGPICSPTRQAIDAVLDADTASGNIYFCASPKLDGTHVFTRSYDQHLKNAKAFQKACAKRKSQKRR